MLWHISEKNSQGNYFTYSNLVTTNNLNINGIHVSYKPREPNYSIVKPKSEVQIPKVKTKTWADTETTTPPPNF